MPWSTRQTASNDRIYTDLSFPLARSLLWARRAARGVTDSQSARKLQVGQRRGRLPETSPAALHPVSSDSVTVQGDGPPHTPARPDSRMSTFLEFLSAAADFALTLNLKAAIVAAGFIVMLMLTRR